MTQHILQPAPGSAATSVVVGYDRPMRTFFVQVVLGEEQATPQVWLGTDYDEITDPAVVLEAIGPYAVAPDGLTAALDRDHREATYRTMAQSNAVTNWINA